jgi:hypothetical protein
VAEDQNGNGRINDEVRQAILKNCDDIETPGTGKGCINAYKTIASLVQAKQRLQTSIFPSGHNYLKQFICRVFLVSYLPIFPFLFPFNE